MNDFTKDELKFIAIALERFAVKDSELDKKIHSLIDNYCEHENVARDTGRRMHICNDCGVPL